MSFAQLCSIFFMNKCLFSWLWHLYPKHDFHHIKYSAHSYLPLNHSAYIPFIIFISTHQSPCYENNDTPKEFNCASCLSIHYQHFTRNSLLNTVFPWACDCSLQCLSWCVCFKICTFGVVYSRSFTILASTHYNG